MSAMIWKELRENFKWAALGMLGLAAALGYVLIIGRFGARQTGGDVLLGLEFQAVTVFGMPAMALGLGFLQVSLERSPDRWAFLVHRPATRTRLLAGKVAAGLLLYLAAAGIPLLLACLWVASPGRYPAPFALQEALPGVADWLNGVVWYLLGIVVAVRSARWYGSRIMPLGLGIVCSVAVVVVPEFWQAAACAGLGIVIAATAAWGGFVAGGDYSPQPRMAKVALGIVSLCGIWLTMALCYGIGGAVTEEIQKGSRVGQVAQSYTYYTLDEQGQILRVTVMPSGAAHVTGPEGEALTQYVVGISHERLQQMGLNVASARAAGRDVDLAQLPYRMRKPYLNVGEYGGVRWYLWPEKGFIEGYDLDRRVPIGNLGPDGFTAGDPPQRTWPNVHSISRFDGEQLWLVARSVVDRVDLRRREVQRTFEAPAGQEVLGVGAAVAGEQLSRAVVFETIVTDRMLHVRTPEGQAIFAMPVAHDPHRYWVEVYKPLQHANYFVWYRSQGRTYREWVSLADHVMEVSPRGEIVQRYELPPVRPPPAPVPTWQAATVGVGMPTSMMAGAMILSRLSGEWISMEELRAMGAALWVTPLASAVSGVMCAAIGYGIARRYAFSRRRRVGWSVLNLLLGPGGLLLMLALQEWPARERCASCGRLRVVTRQECEHCGAEFAPAPLDGTEILSA